MASARANSGTRYVPVMLLTLYLLFRLVIGGVVDTPIQPCQCVVVEYQGATALKCAVPDQVACYHEWRPGSLLVNGHNPGVFSRLDEVEVGDAMVVTIDGVTTTYYVTTKEVVRRDDHQRYTELANVPGVLIVTCYGEHHRLLVKGEI